MNTVHGEGFVELMEKMPKTKEIFAAAAIRARYAQFLTPLFLFQRQPVQQHETSHTRPKTKWKLTARVWLQLKANS